MPRFCIACGNSVIGFFNLLLLCSALALGGLIALARTDREIPLPHRLVDGLNSHLRSQGIVAGWDRASIDLTAGIRAEGLVLSDLQGERLATARQGLLQLDTTALLIGRFEADSVRLDDAALFVPARFSSSGTNEPVLDGMELFLRPGYQSLIVEPSTARLGELALRAEGTVELPQGDEGQEELRLAGRLQQVAERLQSVSDTLKPLGSALVAVDLDTLRAHVQLPPVRWKEWALSASQVDLVLNKQVRPQAAELEAATLTGPGIQAQSLAARFTLPQMDRDATLAAYVRQLAGEVYVHSIDYRGEDWRGLYVQGGFDAGGGRVNAYFRNDGLPLHLSWREGHDVGRQQLHLYGIARQRLLMALAQIDPEPIYRRFRVMDPLVVNVDATLKPDFSDPQVQFSVDMRDVDSRGTQFDHIFASGWANSAGLVADEVHGSSGPAEVSGRFEQDFKTLDWRILVKGKVFPVELGPMLGHWWQSIWTDFSFEGPPMFADVTVSGNWHDRDTADALGRAKGGGFSYNGVPIEEADLSLLIGRGYVSIYDLEARSTEGTASGDLNFVYPQGAPMRVLFDMDASLPLATVNQAVGAGLDDVAAEFTFQRPPVLHFEGWTGKLSEDGDWFVKFDGTADADAGSWRGIAFDSIGLVLHHEDDKTEARDVVAQMNGGGLLTGELDFSHGEQPRFQARVNLAAAPLGITLDNLARMSGEPPLDTTDEERKGRVSIEFDGGAEVGNVLPTLSGTGTMAIDQAELAHISIFGALSKLLDTLGLGFSSFNFDRMGGAYRIGGERLHFKELQVEGPSARIHMEGSLGLEEQDLDFDARVFLMQTDEPSLVSLIGALLSPLGYFLELHLSGDIEDPGWRFKIFGGGDSDAEGAYQPSRGPVRR